MCSNQSTSGRFDNIVFTWHNMFFFHGGWCINRFCHGAACFVSRKSQEIEHPSLSLTSWRGRISIRGCLVSKYHLSRIVTKPTKWHVRPAKTQISLGIRPVWSEYSLCAHWVAKEPSFLHADSEDSDQSGRMPRLIWVFAGRTCPFVGFVMRRLISTYLYMWYDVENYFTLHSGILCVSHISRKRTQTVSWLNMILLTKSIKILENLRNDRWWLWQSYTAFIIIWARSCENVSYAICEQQRCRSACACAQSDQHLCCSLPR